MFSNKVFNELVLLFTERAFIRQKCTGRITGVFLLCIGLYGIIVRLLWFE